jgi:hypothetical protein
MSDNISFILQSVRSVSYDQRPIPESVIFPFTILLLRLSDACKHSSR